MITQHIIGCLKAFLTNSRHYVREFHRSLHTVYCEKTFLVHLMIKIIYYNPHSALSQYDNIKKALKHNK